MPTWNASTDADCTAWATARRPGAGSTRASVCPRACATAARAAGDSLMPASRWSSVELNWVEMTAPIAAIAIRPATRATALLTPEAIPAFHSSASDSTAAVSGATVEASPSENTSSGGSRSVK